MGAHSPILTMCLSRGSLVFYSLAPYTRLSFPRPTTFPDVELAGTLRGGCGLCQVLKGRGAPQPGIKDSPVRSRHSFTQNPRDPQRPRAQRPRAQRPEMKALVLTITLGLFATLQAQEPLSTHPETQDVSLQRGGGGVCLQLGGGQGCCHRRGPFKGT